MGPQDRRHHSTAPQYKQCRIECCWSARAATDMSPGGGPNGHDVSRMSRRIKSAAAAAASSIWLQDSDHPSGGFRALPVKARMLMGGLERASTGRPAGSAKGAAV